VISACVPSTSRKRTLSRRSFIYLQQDKPVAMALNSPQVAKSLCGISMHPHKVYMAVHPKVELCFAQKAVWIRVFLHTLMERNALAVDCHWVLFSMPLHCRRIFPGLAICGRGTC
jgi:hypothetical protein